MVAENDNTKLSAVVTLNAITAANSLGGEVSHEIEFSVICLLQVTCLVAGAGAGVQDVAKEVAGLNGVTKVLVADNAGFNGFLPEKLTPLLVASQDKFKFSHIVAGASAFSRGLLPRVAAKLDVSPISDIIGIKVSDILTVMLTSSSLSYFRMKTHLSEPFTPVTP